MIKFFRRIRQQLLSENKISKYGVYALGEIILVVIGILIALSINNWNENRKDRAYELKMLKELSIATENDIAYTKDHILGYRTRESEKSVEYFKRLLKNQAVPMDSMDYYFEWLTYDVSIQTNDGPYQALKSVGLDKISNDSLRNAIQYTYDFKIPRHKKLLQWGKNEYKDEQKRYNYFFYEDTKYSIQNEEVQFERSLPKTQFWIHPNFVELLRICDFKLSWRRRQYEAIISDFKTLKTLIDLELENK